MMRSILLALISSISVLVSQAQVSAKRKAPKEVIPVVVGNVQYTAPADQIGYVIATDIVTDTVIWKKKIYTIHYNEKMEKDVQDRFIDSLYIKGKNLMIHREGGGTYSLRIIN